MLKTRLFFLLCEKLVLWWKKVFNQTATTANWARYNECAPHTAAPPALLTESMRNEIGDALKWGEMKWKYIYHNMMLKRKVDALGSKAVLSSTNYNLIFLLVSNQSGLFIHGICHWIEHSAHRVFAKTCEAVTIWLILADCYNRQMCCKLLQHLRVVFLQVYFRFFLSPIGQKWLNAVLSHPILGPHSASLPA